MKTNLDRNEGKAQRTAISYTQNNSDEIEKSLAHLKEYESLLSY